MTTPEKPDPQFALPLGCGRCAQLEKEVARLGEVVESMSREIETLLILAGPSAGSKRKGE